SIRIWIPHALNNGEITALVERFHRSQAWMKPDSFLKRYNPVLWYSNRRPRLEIEIILKRNNRVESIVSSGQLDHDQNGMVAACPALNRGIQGLSMHNHARLLNKYRHGPTKRRPHERSPQKGSSGQNW